MNSPDAPHRELGQDEQRSINETLDLKRTFDENVDLANAAAAENASTSSSDYDRWRARLDGRTATGRAFTAQREARERIARIATEETQPHPLHPEEQRIVDETADIYARHRDAARVASDSRNLLPKHGSQLDSREQAAALGAFIADKSLRTTAREAEAVVAGIRHDREQPRELEPHEQAMVEATQPELKKLRDLYEGEEKFWSTMAAKEHYTEEDLDRIVGPMPRPGLLNFAERRRRKDPSVMRQIHAEREARVREVIADILEQGRARGDAIVSQASNKASDINGPDKLRSSP